MITDAQGKLMVLVVGPSGSGKGTLMHEVSRQDPRLTFFITATTRPPREGEFDGVHYHFLDKKTFAEKVAAGEFLEHDDHYSHSYGTLKSVVEGHMSAGDDVISDLNWRGVQQAEEKMPDNVFKILILPPNLKELRLRVSKRAETSKETPAQQASRLASILDDMLRMNEEDYVFTNEDMAGSKKSDYDAVIMNDDLDTAVNEMINLIKERRARA